MIQIFYTIMSKKYRKKCFAPGCNSNSKDHPTKIIIRLPMGTEIRKKWALAVGRTGKRSEFHPTSGVYCCEDHFNLPVDIENWMEVKLHGARIRLREGALPFNKKPSSKSLRSLLKRTTIEKPDSNHIQELNTQEIISSEDEIQVEKTKYVKHCFVPNCNKNSLENPNKLYFKLPEGIEIRKKFAEVLGRKGMQTDLHESSEVFCCTDHIDFSKSTDLPHILSSSIHNSESQTNKKNDESLRIETEPESEDTSNLRQLLGRQSPSTEFVAIKSESLELQSFQIENSDPVLIKVEPDIPEYIKLEPETEENASTEMNTEFEGEEMQIVEEVQHSSEEIETQDSEETEISENKVVVLRDDVLEHRELRSFLLEQLSKTRVKQLETPISHDRDIQCNLRSSKPDYRSKATSIEIKHLSDGINQSLYQERSSEVLKLLQETQGRSGKRIKYKGRLNASCNLDFTKKLIKAFPLRYTGLPLEIFEHFMANVVRGTKLPYNRVLLALLKIRENQSFQRLGDEFGIPAEKARTRFLQSVPLIANYLQKKVAWPQIGTETEIPFSFDSHFENIKLILDCLEVEVEKPKDAKAARVLTNSEKYCYTVKYLISYTRTGLINCMSSGYGGSRSDEFLLDTSGYLSRFSFTKKALVLTDKSYPESEELFSETNCKLIRLGEEVERLEGFTCLKKLLEYVENIMKRLREFRYISRHAFLSQDLTSVLDYVVIIASAIVNAQGPIIPSVTDQH